jgi:iron uptake system EfeUOB component EfeO/EfeM
VAVEDLTESVDKIKIETSTKVSASDGSITEVTAEKITEKENRIKNCNRRFCQ